MASEYFDPLIMPIAECVIVGPISGSVFSDTREANPRDHHVPEITECLLVGLVPRLCTALILVGLHDTLQLDIQAFGSLLENGEVLGWWVPR